jgi:hypothetical protein
MPALSLPLLPRDTPYKTQPEFFLSHWFSPSSSSRASSRAPSHSQEFFRGRPTPPKSQGPKASSPPPLASQSALVKLLVSLGRNQSDPVPLRAGGARGPPQRRRPPSAPPPAKLGIAIAPPHFHNSHARPIRPCSLAPRREREHAATAAATPRRRPCFTAYPCAHHPPSGNAGPVGRAEPVPPRQRPRR